MATIAGHEFQDTPGGRVCIGYSGSKNGPCSARWLHVRTAREADIQEYGFSHLGKLSATEFHEIRREVEREEVAIWLAVVYASSSGPR